MIEGRVSKLPAARFEEPRWDAPFDKALELASIPASAAMSGMFLAPLVIEAKRRGVVLPSARDRYLPFKFYPLREHASLLVETCERLYPDRSIRLALRKLGRGAPKALIASTLGKVVLGSVEGVHEVVEAMARAYPLNVRPSDVSIAEKGPTWCVVRLKDIHYFLDSHHVGAFEGVMRHAGVSGQVLILPRERGAADFLLEWSDRPPPSSE